MKRKIFLIIIFIVGCSGDNYKDVIKHIKHLEYSRNTDTTLYNRYINHDDIRIQDKTIEAMARIQDTVFIPMLIKKAKSGRAQLIPGILFALGQTVSESAENFLIECMQDPDYEAYYSEIMKALGRCGTIESVNPLLRKFDKVNDSLKTVAIQSLTFIYKRESQLKKKKQLRKIAEKVQNTLKSNSTDLKTAAIYFCARNNDAVTLDSLYNIRFTTGSQGMKYWLKTLSQQVKYIKPDSALQERVFEITMSKKLPWTSRIYAIKLMEPFQDSTAIVILSKFLSDKNPHVRKATIESMGRFSNPQAKDVLLNFYDQADWSEKGLIILAFSRTYPPLAHRLIQQNLDQGTVYFKELLLESMANIRDRMLQRQLKQFLNVSDNRLKLKTFFLLDKKSEISYKDVKNFLFSGDPVLTDVATYWIGQNPEYGNLEDLKKAYNSLKGQHEQAMLNIVTAMTELDDSNVNSFLLRLYKESKSSIVFNKVKDELNKRDIDIIEERKMDLKLFVPDSIFYTGKNYTAVIQTEKGSIEIELLTESAPLTVANFVDLAEKGFYENITFHRVVADFVVQAGDPGSTGWGGVGYSIPCEYNTFSFRRGSIGMATSGKDTGGSQFFICHSDQPHLRARYTLFGQVTAGLDVVDFIQKDDKILGIDVIE